jgi:hypothetical protein
VAECLGVRFFIDAKAQYESAIKWRWVFVALLVYLHLGLVVPFVADTREKAKVERQLTESRTAEGKLQVALDGANKLAKQLGEAKDRIASDLKAKLVDRFRRLSTAVSALSALDPTEAERSQGASLFAKPPPPQMQQQVVQQDPSALEPMPPALRRRIAETARAVGAGEVPSELQAYIESKVIEPALVQAKEEWAKSGLTIAQDQAAPITEGIKEAKAALPAAAKELDNLETAVEALRSEAQRLSFERPANPDWWRTVSGKEATILSMTADFSQRIGNFNINEIALRRLTAQIADLARKHQEAATALNAALAELDKRAADLQSRLGEIGAPLKVIAFKLAEIAPLLPLIIAAILAAIAAWTAEGLRRLTLAAELVGEDTDSTAVHRWLHAAAGGSRAWIAGTELTLAIASVAWVLVAAWNVAALPTPFLTQPIFAVIAAAAVIAARANHWRRADEAAIA